MQSKGDPTMATKKSTTKNAAPKMPMFNGKQAPAFGKKMMKTAKKCK